MSKKILAVLLLGSWAVGAQGALVGRLPSAQPGASFQAYYDTVLDITWVADASLAKTTGYDADGRMNWPEAHVFISSLNAANYLGASNWRLPEVGPVNGSYFSFGFSHIGKHDLGQNLGAPGTVYAGSTGSEFSHLMYNSLGLKSLCDPVLSSDNTCVAQAGSGLEGASLPFANVDPNFYWTGTIGSGEFRPFTFSFDTGSQFVEFNEPSQRLAVWAVRDGDIAPVPAPATVWLFGAALAMLGKRVSKRRSN